MVNSRRSNELRSQRFRKVETSFRFRNFSKGVRAYAQSTFNVSRQQAHRDTVKAMADRSKDKGLNLVLRKSKK